MIPTAVPWELFLQQILFVLGRNITNFENNVLPSYILSTSP